jgi:hypothetical protein
MTYTYSITDDFPNSKLDLTTLIDEITYENLSLEHIVIKSDQCEIITTLDLTTEQKTLLDFVVSSHSGIENIENNIEHVKILEEQVNYGTQGHFQSTVIDLYISGQTGTTYVDYSFPFNISLFSSEWLVSKEQIGDIAEFQLSPDTIVGVLTSDANVDDNILNVSPTVVENVSIGYWININGIDLNRIVKINKDNNTLTLEEPINNNFTSGSYVKMTIKIVPSWRFTAPGFCSVGESKIGASFIPANTVMRLVYHNYNTTPKWFGISIDYLY